MLWALFLMAVAAYLLCASHALAAGAAGDPSAPLDILKTARTRANGSTLNVASATTGGNNILNIIIIVMGLAGAAAASISGYALWNNIHQGEQARGSNTTYMIGTVMGAMLTIIMIIVGVVTNYVTAA